MQEVVIPVPPAKRDLTHGIFRYPAKFHPPVVDLLLRRYTTEGQLVLDPFCGSGTLMVEASALGRRSIGTDVDPLAVAISSAKTRAYDQSELEKYSTELQQKLAEYERGPDQYAAMMYSDLNDEQFEEERRELWIPAIPRLNHWFRRYVTIDLATIRGAIMALTCDEATRDLFLVIFASIVRNASNADPVPVSGLEVTSHMLRREAEGRLVNPFALFRAKCKKTLTAIALADDDMRKVAAPEVFQADATTLDLGTQVDAVITSPPYHNAVDYYRRHQLEMFWLKLTDTQADRLLLLPQYIGKPRISHGNPALTFAWRPSPVAKQWELEMAAVDANRARDFRAYLNSMARVFAQLAKLLPSGAPAVFVVGRSAWNGGSIPTDALFVELAHEHFSLDEHLTYPVKNRYMSYTRHNGASIDHEHVLVFRRRPSNQ